MIRSNSIGQLGRSLFGGAAESGVRSRLAGSQRLQAGSSREIRISLSSGGKALGKAAALTKAAPSSSPQGGLLTQMLRSVGAIAARIGSVKSSLKESTEGSEQHAALSRELSDLGGEFQRIISGDSFKQAAQYLRQIEETMRQGAAGGALYQSLAGGAAFLGEGLLAGVQGGDLFKISTLGQSLSQIAGIDSAALASDDGLLSRVANAVTSALDALTGTLLPETAAAPAAVPVIEAPQEPILPTQVTYVGAEKIALSLRAYRSEDMLKLAAAHADIDPSAALMLVPNPPLRGKDKQDDWLEEQSLAEPEWRASARVREEARVEKAEEKKAEEQPKPADD